MTQARTLIAVLAMIAAPSAATAQSHSRGSSSFEVQFGVQSPLSSVRQVVPTDRSVFVTRGTGVSLGLLLYSSMDDVVGFRIRGDIQLNNITARTFDAHYSKRQQEYSIGIDASPRFLRIAARGAEARFYAGTALRLSYVPGTDCNAISGGNPWCSDVDLVGSGGDVIGRAGWFIRGRGKPSLLRLDVSYQYGMFSVTRHELVFRIGVGSY